MALGVTASLALAWAVDQHLDILGVWTMLAAVVAVTLATAASMAPQPLRARPSTLWIAAGLLLAVSVGLVFRLSYLWVVPIGWDYEPLGFVFFAHRLVCEHFPYIPYAWYAHTLFSYVIALFMLVCDSELVAFRLASLTLSLATLGALFLCLRRLADTQVAWIGTALLGASYWHMFATRNGYHQILLPLFQILLIWGVVDGLETRRWRGFAIAAVAMALGLHSHWGYYLMPPLCAVLAAYVYVLHRDTWRANQRRILTAAALAGVLVLPLAIFYVWSTDVFGYVLEGFTLHKSDSPDLASKLVKNLRFVLWDLSGHPHAQAEYGPVVDPVVAATALVGLGLSIRWFRHSIGHAALVLLFLINVAGLSVTIANHFYIIATIAAVYAFAAIAISATIEAWRAVWAPLGPLLVVGALGLIGWQAQANYQEFYAKRIFRELKVPNRPPGAFYPLLDSVRAAVAGGKEVYIPQAEPGRDFDAQLFELAHRVPSFSFMLATRPFNAARVLFPPAEVGDAAAIDVLLPNGPSTAGVTLPTLRDLYPRATVQAVEAPAPYRAHGDGPVAYAVTIPRADVQPYQGLRSTQTGPGEHGHSGFVYAPTDGRYAVRAAVPVGQRLWLHDVPVDLDSPAGSEILLEAGLHPVRLLQAPGDGSTGLEWRTDDGPWQSIDPWLVNPGGKDASHFEPYLSHLGRRAPFYLTKHRTLEVPAPPQEALFRPDGAMLVASARDVTLYDSTGAAVERTPFDKPADVRMADVGADTVLINPRGDLRAHGQEATTLAALECAPADYVSTGSELIVLCVDGRLVTRGRVAADVSAVLGPDDKPLLRPVDLARDGETLYVVDAQASRLCVYTLQGERRRCATIGNLDYESDVEVDPDGNLYLKRRGQGIKVYGPDGRLLFHPVTGKPMLFTAGADGAADTMALERLKFAGDRVVGVAPYNVVVVYERVPAPAPGAE